MPRHPNGHGHNPGPHHGHPPHHHGPHHTAPPAHHHGFSAHGTRPFPTAEDADSFEALLGPDEGRAAVRLFHGSPPEIALVGSLIAALYRRLLGEPVLAPHDAGSAGDGHDVPAHVEDH